MNRTQMEGRARILHNIREYFSTAGYLEVDTPLLAPALIPESTIEAFRSDFVSPFISDRDLYLLPSPELWMKRLIAEGAGNIFQICHSFRNAESIGPQHSPEFTMLEWYTMNATYQESMMRCENLVSTLIDREVPHVDEEGRRRLREMRPPFRRMSMNEAFNTLAGVDLEQCNERDALFAAVQQLGLRPSKDDSWQELFNRIFVSRVEPEIAAGPPTILTDFPAKIATLARPVPGTPWCERWELYLDGRETANCYTEDTDPVRVAAYFQDETREKAHALVPIRVAEDFPEMFDNGFPDCSGTALGVDRLIMALTGIRSIQGVIFFPIHDTLLA